MVKSTEPLLSGETILTFKIDKSTGPLLKCEICLETFSRCYWVWYGNQGYISPCQGHPS